MSNGRLRVSGTLSRGRRGLNLTTEQGELWVIETDQNIDHLIGGRILAEGIHEGLDRLRADWVGTATENTNPK